MRSKTALFVLAVLALTPATAPADEAPNVAILSVIAGDQGARFTATIEGQVMVGSGSDAAGVGWLRDQEPDRSMTLDVFHLGDDNANIRLSSPVGPQRITVREAEPGVQRIRVTFVGWQILPGERIDFYVSVPERPFVTISPTDLQVADGTVADAYTTTLGGGTTVSPTDSPRGTAASVGHLSHGGGSIAFEATTPLLAGFSWDCVYECTYTWRAPERTGCRIDASGDIVGGGGSRTTTGGCFDTWGEAGPWSFTWYGTFRSQATFEPTALTEPTVLMYVPALSVPA